MQEESRKVPGDLIFLSYASEDHVFAEWLERKLVALGYAVWRDKSKMLGGETWPSTIESAMQHSFRMLAVISQSSVNKEPPIAERTKGLSIGKKRGLEDFVIPLCLDHAEPDWTIGVKSTIDFSSGWLQGLRQLLKKLESLNTPKVVTDGALRAVLSFQPEGLTLDQPERLRLNVIGTDSVANLLQEYRLPVGFKADLLPLIERTWACYPAEGTRRAYAICPPTEDLQGIEAIGEPIDRHLHIELAGIPTSNIITSLIKKSMHVRLLRLGFKRHPNPHKADVFYLEPSFTANGKLPYSDHTGPRRPKKIQGYKSFGPKDAKYKVMHNLAVRVGLAPGLDDTFRVLLAPTIHLFHDNGTPIVDTQVNTKRKGITQGWHNDEWLDRFLCMAHVLLSTQADSADGIVLSEEPIWLESTVSINEKALEPIPDDEDGEEVNEADLPVFDEDED